MTPLSLREFDITETPHLPSSLTPSLLSKYPPLPSPKDAQAQSHGGTSWSRRPIRSLGMAMLMRTDDSFGMKPYREEKERSLYRETGDEALPEAGVAGDIVSLP